MSPPYKILIQFDLKLFFKAGTMKFLLLDLFSYGFNWSKIFLWFFWFIDPSAEPLRALGPQGAKNWPSIKWLFVRIWKTNPTNENTEILNYLEGKCFGFFTRRVNYFSDMCFIFNGKCNYLFCESLRFLTRSLNYLSARFLMRSLNDLLWWVLLYFWREV